jgi:bifunctional UDP-N-acetylglucosamine pyrophosphorylase / glucosamine-1-phosphate N-acetyltransferase
VQILEITGGRDVEELRAIVLAAGKSTRMKTKIPKVLHQLMGRPLIDYVVGAVECLGAGSIYMVVGFEMEQVEEYLKSRVTFVSQREQRGTGHAVQQVMPHLEGYGGKVLILCGDMPLITKEILEKFVASHIEKRAPLSMLTALIEGESDFGRIVRTASGDVERIVEYKDATQEERAIREVNLSIYLFDAPYLHEVLPKIGLPNVQKELYLTDTVYLTRQAGLPINAHICGDADAARGVNSRADLALLIDIMRRRIIDAHMREGVTIIDPSSCFIDSTVKIGMDTIVNPFTFIEKNTTIGEDCLIGPFTRIADSAIGRGVTVTQSIVMASSIGEGAQVGPFANVRPETVIGRNAKIGDFVELKKSRIGDFSKVPHLSYIGDATLGEHVNIGAGTITCNYDGVRKNPTFIDDHAHIGSNTNLVAPVKIGKHVVTGAGAVVTQDLPDFALAMGVPAKIKKIMDAPPGK